MDFYFEIFEIHKKFVSQSIFKVGHFPFRCIGKKVMFFQNLDFLYRKSYSKSERFWWLLQDLVFFFRCTAEWSVQLQSWIVRRIFYRFRKTFFKSGSNFGGKNISAIVQALVWRPKKVGSGTKKVANIRKSSSEGDDVVNSRELQIRIWSLSNCLGEFINPRFKNKISLRFHIFDKF